MTDKLPCPHCEQVRDVELVEHDETVTIKGRGVTFKAHLYQCATCGTEFEIPGQLDRNLNAAREAYDRLYEAPTAEQLVALRARYGASQKAFGMILGFGELTMNSYEQGASPDSTNRLLLKLAERPLVFNAMYEINSMRTGALQRQRIEASEGFKSTRGWSGLEALADGLTPLQRQKIEECANCYGESVLQQVRKYVSKRSFQDYSQLMVKATWAQSEGLSTLSSQDSQQVAS